MEKKTYVDRIAKPRKVPSSSIVENIDDDNFIKNLYETGDADKAIDKIKKEQEQDKRRKEKSAEDEKRMKVETKTSEMPKNPSEWEFEDFFTEISFSANKQIRVSEDLFNIISGLSYIRKTTKQAILVNILEQWRAAYKNDIKKEFKALMKQSI